MKRRVAALVLASALAAMGAVHSAEYREEIPFVPTPIEVIDSMLELAEVKKATCFMISAAVMAESLSALRKIRHPRRRHRNGPVAFRPSAPGCKIRRCHPSRRIPLRRCSQSEYLESNRDNRFTCCPGSTKLMKPSFATQLKPGSRIVAHDFGIAGWEPDQTVKLPGYELKPGGYKHQHTLYLWKMSKDRN